jgi:hypothetical protein
MKQSLAIHYDPRLVEEVVFHIQRDSYVLKDLDEERTRIYEVPEPDERERLFNDLNQLWFDQLGLGKAIEQALREQPLVNSLIESCFIVCAVQAKEEGAELFGATDRTPEKTQRRTLRILIRPESLIERKSALTFLRHELFHIADILDLAYAYEPTLPKTDGGPTYDSLITNRYRVLWDVTINGRMVQRGWLPNWAREQQLSEFRQAFPMLEGKTEECFQRFFDAEQPKHSEIAAFALDPRAVAGHFKRPATAGTHCPLCKFPTHNFESEPENLGADLLATIQRDFPHWTPAQGLCAQCADLYRAREMSMAAARLLPGWSGCSVAN